MGRGSHAGAGVLLGPVTLLGDPCWSREGPSPCAAVVEISSDKLTRDPTPHLPEALGEEVELEMRGRGE